MYSNDMTQIRTGLVNYIGAMLKATNLEGKAANQTVAAILIEESLKLSQLEEDTCDLYISKPLLRGVVYILKQRCAQISMLRSMDATRKVRQYRDMIQVFEELIKNI